MFLTKPQVYPILFGCWIIAILVISYAISVSLDHVYPVLPYISDTGTFAPESCIFGLMMTFEAILMLIIVYIRYRQIEDLLEKNDFPGNLNGLNRWSLYTGIFSVFGCLVVANFQVGRVFNIHMMGAGICYICLLIYQIIQVLISFRVYPTIGKKKLNIFRIILTAVSASALATTSICGNKAFETFKGDDITKWLPEDEGYGYHTTSTAAEYVLTISTVLNVATLAEEFKLIEIHLPIIKNKIIEQE